MSDIEIRLYTGSWDNGPESVIEADYEDVSKMSDRELVDCIVKQFKGLLKNTETRLTIVESVDPYSTESNDPVHVRWVPLEEREEWKEIELEKQADGLVRSWRD